MVEISREEAVKAVEQELGSPEEYRILEKDIYQNSWAWVIPYVGVVSDDALKNFVDGMASIGEGKCYDSLSREEIEERREEAGTIIGAGPYVVDKITGLVYLTSPARDVERLKAELGY